MPPSFAAQMRIAVCKRSLVSLHPTFWWMLYASSIGIVFFAAEKDWRSKWLRLGVLFFLLRSYFSYHGRFYYSWVTNPECRDDWTFGFLKSVVVWFDCKETDLGFESSLCVGHLQKSYLADIQAMNRKYFKTRHRAVLGANENLENLFWGNTSWTAYKSSSSKCWFWAQKFASFEH